MDRQLKEKLNAALDKAAETDRIISLKAVAETVGITRMTRDQVIGTTISFKHRHNDYRAVEMVDQDLPNRMLFETVRFVENDIEFEEGDDLQ